MPLGLQRNSTNAFLGVVNILTKKGRAYQGAEVSGEMASHDTYKTRLTYGKRFTNDFEILVSGTHHDRQGQDLYFKEFDDPDNNNGVADGLDGDRYGNLFLNATFRDFTLQGAYIDRDKDIPTAPWGVVFNQPGCNSTDRRSYLDLTYDTIVQEDWEVVARLYYDQYETDESYPYDYAEPGEPLDLAIWLEDAEGEWWGSEIQVTKTFAEKHKVIVGGQYQDNIKQEQRSFDPYWVYLDDNRDAINWAIFVQDEYCITDHIILNAGLRYDHYDTFGESTNPRIGLIVSPFEKTTIKLLYGTAFRAPNVYELYFHDGEETTKANPHLHPEEIATYEIVLEQYVGDRFRLAASGYFYEIDDLITQTTDPEDKLLVFVNSGEVEATGVEVEFEGKWANGMEFRISYTYQDSENKDTGEFLTNSPEQLAKLNIIAPIVRETLYAGVEVQYTDERKTVYDTRSDDFFATNINLFGSHMWKGLSVFASIYNLFDENYAHPGSGEHEQPTIEQDGRIYRIRLTYSF